MKSFTIYEEYFELIKYLNDEDRLAMYDAINNYMFNDIEPEFEGLKNGIWINLKRPLDISKNRGKCGTSKNQKEIKKKSNKNQKEIKKKSNEEQTRNTSNDVYVNVNVDVNNLYNYIESNFNRTLSPIEYEVVSKWEDNELTRYAIQEAVLNRAYSVKYVQAILDRLKAKGITNITEIENKKKEEIPNWVNQENKSNQATPEEIAELEELMREAV